MRIWTSISAVATLALIAATSAEAQSRYNGFSVVLLQGDSQGAPTGDSLPASAGIRKALADVKDFLPYKSYKVLDTQWLRGGETRMKGAGTQEYDIGVTDVNQIMPMPWMKEGMVRINFNLREPGPSAVVNDESVRQAQLANLMAQLSAAKAELSVAETRVEARHPSVQELQRGIAELQKQLEKLKLQPRKLIDTQFDMAIGETVVVGTSRIGGDKGLVVLLTAVAAGGK